MIFHPPTLFIGYVGFTIPFAFAMACLCSGRLRPGLDEDHPQVVSGVVDLPDRGIILGAQWAYVELGWGGYWAWDPVENASFIPWLAGHRFPALRRSSRNAAGVLKKWNVVLVMLTFLLVHLRHVHHPERLRRIGPRLRALQHRLLLHGVHGPGAGGIRRRDLSQAVGAPARRHAGRDVFQGRHLRADQHPADGVSAGRVRRGPSSRP